MLKVNELFSGIGSQTAALKRIGVEHEVVTTSDLDTPAIISYAAIHCDLTNRLKSYGYPSGEEMAEYLTKRNIGYDFKENKPFKWMKWVNKKLGRVNKKLKEAYLATVLSNNEGDISKIEKLGYADLWTYSFPCQDISVAGKQAGITEHTRSGLLYEVERLLNISAGHNELPKYLLLENVKNLVGKKFKAQFDEWLQTLDELGYNNYWKVLNAKNYGIPQNRERVFGISIRKDVDTGDFSFPEGFDNGLRLKDFLEDEVDEKHYISQEKAEKLISQLKSGEKCAQTLETSCNQAVTAKDQRYINNISDDYAFARERTQEMLDNNGELPEMFNPYNKQEVKDIAPTITTSCDRSCSSATVLMKQTGYRIRKLTPKECWRLMGFTDEEFQRAVDAGVSNSQLYKQAGNSICVDVLCYIFRNLIKE